MQCGKMVEKCLACCQTDGHRINQVRRGNGFSEIKNEATKSLYNSSSESTSRVENALHAASGHQQIVSEIIGQQLLITKNMKPERK